ncbi:hypothetical protein BJ165DRAFT_1592471 [Panaeolus papilionaceus]|nr:hypothetical protein BJ165DRAFT_1592471 [Panaeolus papilionaceus]
MPEGSTTFYRLPSFWHMSRTPLSMPTSPDIKAILSGGSKTLKIQIENKFKLKACDSDYSNGSNSRTSRYMTSTVEIKHRWNRTQHPEKNEGERASEWYRWCLVENTTTRVFLSRTVTEVEKTRREVFEALKGPVADYTVFSAIVFGRASNVLGWDVVKCGIYYHLIDETAKVVPSNFGMSSSSLSASGVRRRLGDNIRDVSVGPNSSSSGIVTSQVGEIGFTSSCSERGQVIELTTQAIAEQYVEQMNESVDDRN